MKRLIVSAVTLALVFVLALAGCRPGGTKTENATEFYAGKTITIVVPYAAGGGTDTQSRIFAPFLRKYTGASNVVIENVTGAGGNKGNNYVYNTAKPDGLTLGAHLGDTMILAQLLGQEGVQYDVANYNWIGRWFIEDQALSIGGKLPYTTPKELAGLIPYCIQDDGYI